MGIRDSTYRQLDNWTRRLDLPVGHGTGNRRKFGPMEIIDLAGVATLVHAGFETTWAIEQIAFQRDLRERENRNHHG